MFVNIFQMIILGYGNCGFMMHVSFFQRTSRIIGVTTPHVNTELRFRGEMHDNVKFIKLIFT